MSDNLRISPRLRESEFRLRNETDTTPAGVQALCARAKADGPSSERVGEMGGMGGSPSCERVVVRLWGCALSISTIAFARMKIFRFLLVPCVCLSVMSCERHPYSRTSEFLHHGDHSDHSGGGGKAAADTHSPVEDHRPSELRRGPEVPGEGHGTSAPAKDSGAAQEKSSGHGSGAAPAPAH